MGGRHENLGPTLALTIQERATLSPQEIRASVIHDTLAGAVHLQADQRNTRDTLMAIASRSIQSGSRDSLALQDQNGKSESACC
jgi:hypothetical protein